MEDANQAAASKAKTGVIAALIAYTWWGLIPLYFVATKAVPAWELLAHRVLWSVLFGIALIHFRGQWTNVYKGLTNTTTLKYLSLCALLIATNWVVFILAVQHGEIFQSSLGYYINPLLNIVVGAVVLREALRGLQWLAVLCAAIGVAVLSTVGDAFPAYAMVMAVTFCGYGFIRRHMESIGEVPSLFVETLVLLPLALGYLIYLSLTSQATLPSAEPSLILTVILIGPVSLIPLLAFAIAARRLRFSTLGFLQFLGPSMHFAIGYLMGEAFTPAHQICFVLIWLAAVMMMWDLRRSRSFIISA